MKRQFIIPKSFKNHLLIFIPGILLLFNNVSAQSSVIEWQHTFGGTDYDMPAAIIQTDDGGYLAAGTTRSTDGDVKRNFGDADGLLLKVDANGNNEWLKYFGSTGDDEINTVIQLKSGAFLAAGDIYSVHENSCINHGFRDAWVMKLSGSGKLLWQRSYGGSQCEMFKSAIETDDGGYLFGGITTSRYGNVKLNHGHSDYWVVKTDSNGILLWQKTFGGAGSEILFSIIQTSSAEYVLAGTTQANAATSIELKNPREIWLVKIDGSGDTRWQKIVNKSESDDISTVNPTHDGGFILGVVINSTEGDLGDGIAFQKKRCSIIKFNEAGFIQWKKSLYHSGGFENPVAVFPGNNGGYIICGTINYSETPQNSKKNQWAFFFYQLNDDLNTLSERSFDGEDKMMNCYFDKCADGSFIVLSGIFSRKHTVRTQTGFEDIRITKPAFISTGEKSSAKNN
jgi:hypothetical protein